MRLWIDTDAGDHPDDTVALWCAARSDDVDLAGVSTVHGDVARRAEFVRGLLPGVEVVAGAPAPEQMTNVDVLLGIGPWTNVAALSDAAALPLRVVLMGGALAPIRHRGQLTDVEYNVGSDPDAARRLLRTTGNMIVVPLDATVNVRATEQDEKRLANVIPGFGDQLDAWRQANGDLPFVLHDVAALLVALGDRVARMESRRLTIDSDGTMRASVDGPLQYVVAHIDTDETRARMRTLAGEGD
jgi:purine nucleosidase